MQRKPDKKLEKRDLDPESDEGVEVAAALAGAVSSKRVRPITVSYSSA
jgi:hypothetical protein